MEAEEARQAPAAGAGDVQAAQPAVTFKQIGEALRPVQDPEIRISLSELGLIYGVQLEPDPRGGGTRVRLRMSLTSPACPYAPMLLASVHAAVSKIPGVTDADVDLAFEPIWDPRSMASEEAQEQLGIF